MAIDREAYERDLKRRQEAHLQKIQTMQKPWQPCAHDACTQCVGTGRKADGSACIHGLVCTCPKCSPRAML